VNNGEGQDRTAAAKSTPTDGASGARHRAEYRESAAADRRPGAHDDRVTAILPPVTAGPKVSDLRDPIDQVKAALDNGPRPRGAARPATPPPPPPKDPGDRGGWEPDPDGEDAPSGRRRFRFLPAWSARRWLAAAAAVFIVLPLLTFGLAYLIVDVPKPGDIRTNQVSTILASDGSELAKIVPPDGNRVDVDISQVPVQARNAVMAAEDRDFYSNPGFSLSGFARAFHNNLFGNDIQGGSTITQQYVKNALVGDQRTGFGGLIRKAKELVISTKMSQSKT
jgi:hypothetical protein